MEIVAGELSFAQIVAAAHWAVKLVVLASGTLGERGKWIVER